MAVTFSRPDPSRPDSVAAVSFSTARRGYQPDEVRSVLTDVSAELRRLQARVAELESEVGDLRATAAASPTEMDEELATRLLGDETVRVLQTARESAAAIRARAEENASRIVREATEESARVRSETEVDAARIREEASRQSESELALAKEQGREMVNEARAYRERVLDELAKRREAARQQIDQLVHGRDRLLQVFERARLVAVDVVSELEPLVEPEEYVDLSPTTGPVPRTVVSPALPRPSDGGAAEVAELGADEDRVDEEPEEARSDAVRAEGPYDASAEAEDDDPAEPSTSSQAIGVGEVRSMDPSTDDPTADAVAEDAEGVPDGTDSLGEDTVETDTAETDAVETDTAETGAVETDTVQTDAVETDAAETDAGEPETAEPESVERDAAEPDAGEPETAEPESVETDAAELDVSDNVVSLFAEDPSRSRADVDQLFARLRAEAEGTGDGAGPDAVARDTDELTADGPAQDARPNDEKSAEDTVSETVFQRRDADLVPLIVAAGRKLKRVLADEQNDVLGALRDPKRSGPLLDLLPDIETHVARYVDSVSAELVGAHRAGALSISTEVPAPDLEAVHGLVGSGLIVPLRDRLERADLAADGDVSALISTVRSVYREWKSQHIDDLLDDVLRLAHGSGVLAAATPGAPMCWAVDPAGPPCPDAEDNALAGTVPAGEPYPTGHRVAPAHVGCRCVLVAADH